MGFWQSVKAWLTTEAKEAKDVGDELQDRLSSDLDRRERELNETPEQAMERLQSKIDDQEDAFSAVADKIDRTEAKADAVSELEAEDVLDLPSEEID